MSERTQSALTYTHPAVWLVCALGILLAIASLAVIVPLAMLAWLRDEVTKEPKRQTLGRIGLDDQGNTEKCTLTTLADTQLTDPKPAFPGWESLDYAKSPQNKSFCPLPSLDIQTNSRNDTVADIAAILKQKPTKRKPLETRKKVTLAHQGDIDNRKTPTQKKMAKVVR